MTHQYAGGHQTRDTIKCVDCNTKRKPLKFYHYWEAWLCYQCNEKRIVNFGGVL